MGKDGAILPRVEDCVRNTWEMGKAQPKLSCWKGRQDRAMEGAIEPPRKTGRWGRLGGQDFPPPSHSPPLFLHPISFLLSSFSCFLPVFFLSLSFLFVSALICPCILSAGISLAASVCQTLCCKLRIQSQKVKAQGSKACGGWGTQRTGWVRSDSWQRELTSKSPSLFRSLDSISKARETGIKETRLRGP